MDSKPAEAVNKQARNLFIIKKRLYHFKIGDIVESMPNTGKDWCAFVHNGHKKKCDCCDRLETVFHGVRYDDLIFLDTAP